MARTMLPVSGLRVQGETVRPFYRPKGNGLRDIREVSGQFFVSLCDVLEQRGDEILHRVADKHPELYFAGMIKFCQVTKLSLARPATLPSLATSRRSSTSWRLSLGRRLERCLSDSPATSIQG